MLAFVGSLADGGGLAVHVQAILNWGSNQSDIFKMSYFDKK